MGMGMTPIPMGKIPRILSLWHSSMQRWLAACLRAETRASLRCSSITDATFRRMTVKIFLSDFLSIVNGVFRIFNFYFSTTDVQISVEEFSVARLSTACIYTFLFTVRVWEWEVTTLWRYTNLFITIIIIMGVEITNSTQLNSTENYGRRCLTPLSPHRNYILS